MMEHCLLFLIVNFSKDKNTTNNNSPNRIDLYCRNQMHFDYKLDEQTKTNNIKRRIKPIEKEKLIKPVIYFTRFKTLNLLVKNNTNSDKILLNLTNIVYKFIGPFRECLSKNKSNIHIGYTTSTLSHCLTNHHSEIVP